jgi:hypothetical protein
LNRNFVEYENLVRANLDVVIQLSNDVNPTEAFGDVQSLIFLPTKNFCLQHAR